MLSRNIETDNKLEDSIDAELNKDSKERLDQVKIENYYSGDIAGKSRSLFKDRNTLPIQTIENGMTSVLYQIIPTT